MKAALGLQAARTRADSSVADEPWLRFRCVGCWCDVCWEQATAAVRVVPGVEVVRLDAGREMLVVKRSGPVAEAVVATLEQTFGYCVTLLDKGAN